MKQLLGFLLLLSLSHTVFALEIPDFKANYLVKLNGIQAGELKRTLTSFDNGLRQFTSVSQAKGVFSFFKPDIVEESTQWRLVKQKVQPQNYLYERSGGKKDKTLSIDFNWQKLTAEIDDKQHPWQLKIEPNTQDKLIYQISLMRDLALAKKEFSYRIADGGKLKTYKIIVLGEEEIETPLGKIKTIKLTRERDKPKDRQTTLWCAPALSYLPVKLEHEEDGTVFTALLRRLRGFQTDTAFTPLQQHTSQSPLMQP